MSIINLGEVAYIVERKRGFMNYQKVLAYIDEIPINFVDAARYAVLKASHLKAQYSISYADCFAASLSQTKNAVLITGDLEFKKVENLTSILWLVNK
jgi:ribonuclease VapC